MAGLVYGDNRIPFSGINDEGDDFDSKPGSLSPESYNVVPNRSFSSLLSRGGFKSKNAFVRATGTVGLGSGAAATCTLRVKSVTVNAGGGGYNYYVLSTGVVPSGIGVRVSGGGVAGTGGCNLTGKTSLQNIGVTFFQITNGGSGYSTPPIVTVSGGSVLGGDNATGTAVLTGDAVTSITVTHAGTYSNGGPRPTVSFNVGAAAATARLDGGPVTQIQVVTPGSGFTGVPTVEIPAPTESSVGSGTQAVATAVMELDAITITSGGSGYSVAPTVVFTGGGGSGMAGTAVLTGDAVTSVTITSRGTGYTSLPTISFEQNVGNVTVTNGGGYYHVAPTVTFSGGGGSGAAGTAVLTAGVVTSVTITNGGSGYTSAPTVSFSYPSVVDFPSVGNGLKTGMSIEKILHMDKFRVTKPEAKTVTILVALCKFTATSGGAVVYMVRVFMSPSYSGGAFGVDSSWQEKEVWYIDDIQTNQTLVKSTSPERYTMSCVANSDGGYFNYDFAGGYVYLEDNDTAIFSSPSAHLAEGDKIIESAYNGYSSSSNQIVLVTESAHSGWDSAGMDTVRFHKNLETGKIPYQDLCSRTSTFFDAYSFETEQVDEKIILSVHTGETGRAPFTLNLGYVNKTFFSTGRIYSKADYLYNTPNTLYDKRLVYGFPGYDNINKSNVDTVFDGKSIKRWPSGRTDMTDASRTVGNDTTVSANGYDKVMGKLTVAGVAADVTGDIYCIEGCDVSIVVDDFVIAEWDVHGRMGAYKEFETHTNPVGGEVRREFGADTNLKNYPEYVAASQGYGAAKAAGETSWFNGIISKIIVSNPTTNTGYTDTCVVDITGTNIGSGQPGTKAIASVVQNEYEKEDRERDLRELKKQLKKVDFTSKAFRRIIKKIQLTISRVLDGKIKDVTVIYGGDGYDVASTAVAFTDNGGGVDATVETTVDESAFYDYVIAVYDGYRYGLHYDGKKYLNCDTAALALYNVLLCDFQIPVNFNRFMTDVMYVISGNYPSSELNKHTLLEKADAHAVLRDTMSSGFDFRLYWDLGSVGINEYGYIYTKVNRVDKGKYDSTDIGGNHFYLTGNPDYAHVKDEDTNRENRYSISGGGGFSGGSSKMIYDAGFGNKSIAFLRDRMFACDSVYCEYQLGSIQDSTVKAALNTVFLTPIPQFGGNFHQFNSSGLQIPVREAGKAVAVVGVSTAQRDDQNQQTNNLLVLCDRGYIYVDLADNDEANFYPYYNQGVSCISRKSVAKYNGKAFWAGENDVYMWDGTQAVPITRLGDSSINKTWRSIPVANKRLAVGVFNEDRKQYWLFVDPGDGVESAFVFDFSLNNIYKIRVPSDLTISVNTCAGFMDGKLWVAGNGSYLNNYIYDESATVDFNVADVVTDLGIPCQVLFNNIKGSDRMSTLQSIQFTATMNSLEASPYVDGITYTTAYSPGTGTKAFKEHKINVEGFASGNNRGRRYSVKFYQLSGYFELFDLTLNIDPNVPQDSLIGGLT